MPLSVIVVGGGIAGLAAGVALREFADVTILELAPALREIGAGITIPISAMRVLRSWGIIPEKVKAKPLTGLRQWDGQGELLSEAPVPGEDVGGGVFTSHRTDLYEALFEAATGEGKGRPCIIRPTKKVIEVDCINAAVTTADGSVYKADVVVGADGMWSAVRAFVIPGNQPSPRPVGNSAYRLLVPSTAMAEHPELKMLEIDRQRMNILTSATRHVVGYPCRDGKFFNMFCQVPDVELRDPAASLGSLLDAYGSIGPVWHKLLSCGNLIGLWKLHDMDPLATWVNGRVIIIGDAAHPMLPHLGQGAGQALEDAEALGTLLRDATAATATAALARVFRVRYKRACRVQAVSRARGLPNQGCKQSPADEAAAFQEAIQYIWSYHGAERWEIERPSEILMEEHTHASVVVK